MVDLTDCTPRDVLQGLNITERALREFAGLHHELTEVAGVTVNLWQHDDAHGTPDAVFPNNWFSTHAAGEGGGCVKENTLVLYPMKCRNRCLPASIIATMSAIAPHSSLYTNIISLYMYVCCWSADTYSYVNVESSLGIAISLPDVQLWQLL